MQYSIQRLFAITALSGVVIAISLQLTKWGVSLGDVIFWSMTIVQVLAPIVVCLAVRLGELYRPHWRWGALSIVVFAVMVASFFLRPLLEPRENPFMVLGVAFVIWLPQIPVVLVLSLIGRSSEVGEKEK